MIKREASVSFFLFMFNKDEVLVIPQYDAGDIKDGFTSAKDYNMVLSNSFFVSRDIVKGNNTIRQIVPYIIYENKGKYLATTYIKDEMQSRCIGTYNRVYNDYEFTTLENYVLKYFDVKKVKFIGFLKNTLYHADYIGCVFLSKDKNFSHSIINKEKYEWKNKRDLINEYGSYEVWSKHIIDEYVLREDRIF